MRGTKSITPQTLGHPSSLVVSSTVPLQGRLAKAAGCLALSALRGWWKVTACRREDAIHMRASVTLSLIHI